MKIHIQLYASFRVGRFKADACEYPPETKVDLVVKDLGLHLEDLGIILINGRHACLSESLKDGDVLSLLPFVGGG